MNQPRYEVEVTGVETIYGYEPVYHTLLFHGNPDTDKVLDELRVVYDDLVLVYYTISQPS